LREIVAAGAHGGARPKIHDDPLRPVAMILDMAVQYLLGRALTNLPGGARRHRARIDPVKITPRGEDVDASARRRAARAGRDKAAIERG
jgi:hypothetical protein